jgi:predicted dehydrogenase
VNQGKGSIVDPDLAYSRCIAFNGEWSYVKVLRSTEEDGYLDQAIIDGWVRIQAVEVTQYPLLDGQFFRRPLNIRFVLAYIRDIGLRDVARKICSRLAERVRNERCIVVGLGRVLESREPSITFGSLVPFIVPDSGPPSEHYVVRGDLVGDPWRGGPADDLAEAWRVVRPDTCGDDPDVARIAGWNAYSGSPWPLSRREIATVVGRALKVSGKSRSCSYGLTPVTEREEEPQEYGITIFGYGNYVKTMVIPQLGSKIPVRCVHEIDPWQIGRRRNEHWSWDTSPYLRSNEDPDVVVVASFHHTHAGIAVAAMKRGARAVIIEKPVVTTSTDLEILFETIAEYKTPVFAAFQRRYSPFNDCLVADLGVRPGDPVSSFTIAYEVPLPPQHWYRWPNSGSRIISNGCHWIDHFLYLNSFSPVRQLEADHLGDSSIVIRMSLENGATLLLSLTHAGSPRLGVREHCEFRANGVTVTVTDSKHYISESACGVIRRMRTHRFSAHQRMYRSISDAIVAGGGGDSLQSLWQSSHTVLAAEAALLGATDLPSSRTGEVGDSIRGVRSQEAGAIVDIGGSSGV